MDINNKADRHQIIKEITAYENRSRREEHFKRLEVYNERQAQYIIEELQKEFSAKTVSEMRVITSINLTRRIVDELASIYKKAPTRSYSDLNDAQADLVATCYSDFEVNQGMKRANKLFKLHRQVAIKVVPKNGVLRPEVLSPHHYDVVPDPNDPTSPLAYVISSLQRQDFLKDYGVPSRQQTIGDGINQAIADVDDYLQHINFYWWTKEFNFVTNNKGDLIEEPVPNLIGVLPFIDVSEEKFFEYWVRAGSDIVNFSLDFGKILSDHFNLIRLQGYSQAVILSEKAPDSFVVGPNHILHLKQNPDSVKDPSFQFVTPSPDLGAALESLEAYVRLFLSSRKIETSSIAIKDGGKTFSSGLERLLSMIEKFEASQDDFDVFGGVEQEYYQLFKKWQNASSNNDLLKDEYKVRGIPEASKLNISFYEPQMIQTQTEKEDSAIKLMEAGLISRTEAIMKIRDIPYEEALEKTKEIDQEMSGANVNIPQVVEE